MAIEPVTDTQARIARQAYSDFGKGSGHPAQLNFGDCFAYALAKAKREPLLFKGDDFPHTDVARALPCCIEHANGACTRILMWYPQIRT